MTKMLSFLKQLPQIEQIDTQKLVQLKGGIEDKRKPRPSTKQTVGASKPPLRSAR